MRVYFIYLHEAKIHTFSSDGIQRSLVYPCLDIDALALSRSLYEALVIISTLLEGKKDNDQLLIERFFDAAEITTTKIYFDRAKWVSDNDPNHTLAPKAKEETLCKLQSYRDKYGRKDLKDYWWANADSFTKLAERSGFSKAPMYSRVSGNVHFNAYDVFNYTNPEEQCVLTGETNKGLELPLWFTSHCLYCICGLVHGSYPVLVSECTLVKVRECTERFSKLHQDTINNMIAKLKV